jgi:hypothetical protein
VESLDEEHLVRLGASLKKDTGFVADLDHLAIFGMCRVCAGK